jgi:hypothetical protein
MRWTAPWFVRLWLGVWLLTSTALASTNRSESPTLLLVIGAPGEPQYQTNFLDQAAGWTAAAQRQGARVLTVGLTPEAGREDRTQLEQLLTAETNHVSTLWLVLIGHGTFDGKEARFNARGPDFSASELASWLAPLSRPLIIINTTSSSAPFLQKLSRTNRIVLTATRSGNEQNVTRLGPALSQALVDPEADLDSDQQTSLLEAFLAASERVAESYKAEGRLLTEHALLDDNGDGFGTPPEWYRGLRPIKQPKAGKAIDGRRAHQVYLTPSPAELALSAEVRAQRDALESEINSLRDRKATFSETAYYAELEALLLKLAVLYRDAESASR